MEGAIVERSVVKSVKHLQRVGTAVQGIQTVQDAALIGNGEKGGPRFPFGRNAGGRIGRFPASQASALLHHAQTEFPQVSQQKIGTFRYQVGDGRDAGSDGDGPDSVAARRNHIGWRIADKSDGSGAADPSAGAGLADGQTGQAGAGCRHFPECPETEIPVEAGALQFAPADAGKVTGHQAEQVAAAGQAADAAGQSAQEAVNRVDTLQGVVANLDNYRPVAETSVKFGFNKDNLTPKAKDALDQLAGSIASTKGYIIALEGSTDSVGSAEYNYDLSQRRADSVIQYLASKYNVPAHKIYVIGLGKDKPVESNKTSEGRADNRRVDVRLMTTPVGDTTQPTAAPTGQNNPPSM